MFEWLRRNLRNEKKEVLESPEKEVTQKTLPPPPLSEKERVRQKYASYYLGKIIHYYPKIQVGIIRIERGRLRVGDTIYVQGLSTKFKQKVTSIEYNHQKVKEVGASYEVGIRLGARVREEDDVYLIPTPPTSF